MKGQSNGVRTPSPPERRGGCEAEAKGNGAAHETAQDRKGCGGGGSSPSLGVEATVWPKFTIGLTNKEKEEDFMLIKGTKLPQRPKKRAKFIQRTVNRRQQSAFLCMRVRQLFCQRDSNSYVLHVSNPRRAVAPHVKPRGDESCRLLIERVYAPGSWLCDLSLERYEVREKKISKKRPRGLKAMGSMERRKEDEGSMLSFSEESECLMQRIDAEEDRKEKKELVRERKGESFSNMAVYRHGWLEQRCQIIPYLTVTVLSNNQRRDKKRPEAARFSQQS
ncbi:hypothetical protein ACLOJK_040021 [Asimina triloba]